MQNFFFNPVLHYVTLPGAVLWSRLQPKSVLDVVNGFVKPLEGKHLHSVCFLPVASPSHGTL